ncbi:MAG: glutamyl-tRNA reductase [Bacteroidetes bacterium]|nr:glutamyl-tRNA reductase [Bacteroidota bacterium]MBS1758086.1 glutamyl-tRNA reductase [Bacteroidota bacterium]
MLRETIDISNFFIAGINYKKTDAAVRGKFSVSQEQYVSIINKAPEFGVRHFFILSTCNRTEIYGFAESANQLSKLLCADAAHQQESFTSICYTKSGLHAVEHLFNVAAGLDSQILGDYEIIGQIKQAAKISKEHNCMGAYMERMINEVLNASKEIRTTTALSGGTVSVSFAAVQCIKQQLKNIKGKKILLLGTGKIGSNTCKNIADYLPGTQVTLVNRTVDKASELAAKYQFSLGDMAQLQTYISHSDIIIVATNATNAIIDEQNFKTGDTKIVIDLSVPCNVAPTVNSLPGITLLNVDELSKIKDETLRKRTNEIPKVKIIIQKHIDAFIEWHQMRKHVPVLRAVKSHLEKLHSGTLENTMVPALVANMCDKAAEEKIQKVINGMAVKMRHQYQHGCQYIEAMNDFIATASN